MQRTRQGTYEEGVEEDAEAVHGGHGGCMLSKRRMTVRGERWGAALGGRGEDITHGRLYEQGGGRQGKRAGLAVAELCMGCCGGRHARWTGSRGRGPGLVAGD